MDMREAAEAYCSLVDDGAVVEETAFACQLLIALSDAVAAAVRLPDIEPSDAESPREVSNEQWRARYQRIAQLTEPWWSYYWEALCPFARDQAEAGVGLGDLIDDLADIWRDLKNGLLAFEAGLDISGVEWQWRQG